MVIGVGNVYICMDGMDLIFDDDGMVGEMDVCMMLGAK
jgi:hypothetical protein